MSSLRPRLQFRLMGLLLITAFVAVLVAYWRTLQESSVAEREMSGINYRWTSDEKLWVNIYNEVGGAHVEDVAELEALLDDPTYDCSRLRSVFLISWQRPLPTAKLQHLRTIHVGRASLNVEMIESIPKSAERLAFNDTSGSADSWPAGLSTLPHLVHLQVDELSDETIAAVDKHQALEVLTVRSSSLPDEELQWARRELESVQVFWKERVASHRSAAAR